MVKSSLKKQKQLQCLQDDLGLYITLKNKILNYFGFDNIYKNDKLYSDTLNNIGSEYYQKNNIEKAKEYFVNALKRNQKNKYALYNLAIFYIYYNEYDQAISLLKKVINIDQNYILAYQKLVNINPNSFKFCYDLALAYMENKQFQLAIKQFEASLEIDKLNTDAYYNLGQIYLDQNLEDKAIKSYNQVIKINPKHLDAHYQLGIVYMEQKLYCQAIDCFKKVIEINPNQVKPYGLIFEIYFKQNNMASSFKFYEKVKNIDTYYAYYHLGCAYFNKGFYKQSIIWLKKALKINNNSVQLLIDLGDAFRKNNQIKEAVECYNQVLKTDPEKGYFRLRNAYLNDQQYEQAILSYLQQIMVNQFQRFLYYNLGYAYLQLQQNNKQQIKQKKQQKKYVCLAIECLKREIKQFKDCKYSLYQLGKAYKEKNMGKQNIIVNIICTSKMYPCYQAKIEDSSCYINTQNNTQTSERSDDGTMTACKSHSVLILSTQPCHSRRRKRVRLNDSLSYCIIPNDNHQNRQHSTLNQNHTSSSQSLFQTSLKNLNSGPSNVDLSTQETIQSQVRSTIYDYQSYIESFPDYRLRRICSYKYLKNIDHQNNTFNKSQSYQSASPGFSQNQQQLDYKNLCMLFQDRYFSVQFKDSMDLQEKCLNFIESYQLSLPSNIQFNSNISSKLEEKEEEISANQINLNQNNIKFQINNSQSQQVDVQNNIIIKQKASHFINEQMQKKIRPLKRKQETQIEIENTKKAYQLNSRYQILVKNIQYETIKEITYFQKIEFSKRTISKVINKFILFLKGDYRTLKYYDLDQKCQNGTAQRILKNQDPQFSDEDQNTQARNFNQNCSFELPKFNLFELLEEQDHKEMLQADSNQVNRGCNSIRNQRYSLTSNSSQGQCDKINRNQDTKLQLSHKQNQRPSLSQSTPIYQNLEKSQLSSNVAIKQTNIQCPLYYEQQASQSISNSPKANLIQINQGQRQRKQSESSFCAEAQFNSYNDDSKIQIKQKQTLFNLSKYLMHLILEYLSEEHLDGLQIIPGFHSLIQNVVKRIKKKGQRTEHSQTYYYNHSHYNCLFLLLSDDNIEYVQNQKELMELHQYVYEINDFFKAFDLTQINFIKAIIARLITKQFKLIRQQIDQQIQQNPIKFQTYSNYMITKLQYFERVYQGIKNLKKGQILVRF
ncbi:hypothetical protein ABPG74_015439 [Tetrahymena malaccensis]